MSKLKRAKKGKAPDQVSSIGQKDNVARLFGNAPNVLGVPEKAAPEKKGEREAEARLKKAQSQFYSLE